MCDNMHDFNMKAMNIREKLEGKVFLKTTFNVFTKQIHGNYSKLGQEKNFSWFPSAATLF